MSTSTPPSLGEVLSVAEESKSPVSDIQQTNDPGQTESLIPDEPVVLSCDASVRRWGNKFITLKEKFDAVSKQPAKISIGKFT